ncbi:Protein CLP1, partial [Tetrabaena socialis]
SQELRLECPPGRPVSLRLEEGSAEVFGTELQRGRAVSVTGQKVAVFTFSGCRVAVVGEPSVKYVAEETPMASYLNVHNTLNARREEAQRTAAAATAAATSGSGGSGGGGGGGGRGGPVVLVVGPTDSGKSTLCRLLCNWAVRSGWQPTFVDLD